MIWLDIIDPKYVLFFRQLLPYLRKIDEVFITTRTSSDYSECEELLKLFEMPYFCTGGYGGQSKGAKFRARLDRMRSFDEIFSQFNLPKLLITGASADAVQYAYGVGIPIVQFSDTPIIGHKIRRKDLSKLARLTLPLSDLIFCPFVLPKKCFEILGIQRKNIKTYDFIDVALWLDSESFENSKTPKKDFLKILNLDPKKPIILAREEEFKAHYVKEKFALFYDSVRILAQNLNVQIVIFPRYGIDELVSEFSAFENVKIALQKFEPRDFYPHIDLLLGGGGTMNLESCYLGIPTISTRSIFLFHDKFLIKNGLMTHCKTPKEVLKTAHKILKNHSVKMCQDKLFFKEPKTLALQKIIKEIKNKFYL